MHKGRKIEFSHFNTVRTSIHYIETDLTTGLHHVVSIRNKFDNLKSLDLNSKELCGKPTENEPTHIQT